MMAYKRRTRPAICVGCGSQFEARVDSAGLYCTTQCCNAHRSGSRNNRYNSGLCFDKDKGRWVICCRDGTLLLYSRGVMAAELGRLLASSEIVHHLNEDPTDDRPENLEIHTRSTHIEEHRPALQDGRRRSGGRVGRGYIRS